MTQGAPQFSEDRRALACARHRHARALAIEGANTVKQVLAARLVGDVEPETMNFEGHVGAPPAAIDAEMSFWFRDRIEALGIQYDSEDVHAALNVAPGVEIGSTDPVDGTELALGTFGSWSVVVLFDVVRSANSRSHVTGAIATSNGAVVSWWCVNRLGAIWCELSGPLSFEGIQPIATETKIVLPVAATDSAIGLVPGRADLVGAVAWTPTRRRLLREAWDLDRADIYLKNTAGTPEVLGLLRGKLGAMIEVEQVQLHDAAHLIPLVMLGGSVVTPAGDETDVFKHFERLHRKDRKIGPYVAASNPEALARILASRAR